MELVEQKKLVQVSISLNGGIVYNELFNEYPSIENILETIDDLKLRGLLRDVLQEKKWTWSTSFNTRTQRFSLLPAINGELRLQPKEQDSYYDVSDTLVEEGV